MSGGFILDTPEQIRAFGLLQIYYKLKLEVEHPNGPKWAGSPKKQALLILAESGIVPENTHLKRTVFVAYKSYLVSLGILKECDGHGQ